MNAINDLRYAARVLTRTPAFTLPAILSLALGTGATTTIFSVVNALLLRPLAATDTDTLIRIGQTALDNRGFFAFSHTEFLYLRDHNSTLAGVVGHQPQSMTLSGAGGPQVAWGEIVTGNYFTVLGVTPALGRGFLPEEDRVPGERPVIAISHGLWQRRFGSDASIAGKTVPLNGRAFTIVGVMPPGFRGTFPGFDIDLWVPVMMQAVATPGTGRLESRSDRFLMLIGRRKPGVSAREVLADLRGLAAQLAQAYPETNRDRGIDVAGAIGVHPFIATLVKAFLGLLMGVVGLVLLIACANVANLLLARAAIRRKELAVRLAIGAGRSQVVRQLLIESLALALAGGAAGLLLAFWSVRALNAFHPPTGVPIALDLAVDQRVLLFTLIVSSATAVIFGLAPALQATRFELVSSLKDESRLGVRSKSRLRDTLVVVQIALSLLLLIGAALLVRSLRNSDSIDPGFDPNGVVVASFDPEMLGYSRARVERFYEDLLARVRALPETESAAFADYVLMGDRGDDLFVTVPGQAPSPDRDGFRLSYNRVSPGYFHTLRLPLLDGRDFTERDRAGSAPVAIVNAAVARRFWPNAGAVGQRIRVRGETADREIVGITKDAKYRSLGEEPRPYLFLPAFQYYRPFLTLHVRSAIPARTLEAIKTIVAGIDKEVAHEDHSMRESMAFSLVPVDIARTVLGVSGIIALLLAVAGLYGLVSYTVAQRMKEIGIRIALGAGRAHIFAVVVGDGLKLAAIGAIVGLAGAAAGTRLLAAFIFGLSATDPLTFAGVAIVLMTVAVAASYVAARRGMAVDPMVALRHE